MGYVHYYSNKKTTSPEVWSSFVSEAKTLVRRVNAEVQGEPVTMIETSDDVLHLGYLHVARYPHDDMVKTTTDVVSPLDSYDAAVCAVLISAHHWLGETVSSDGDWDGEGWRVARRIYSKVTGRIATCPWPTRACARCHRRFKTKGHKWGGNESCAKCGGGSWRGSQSKSGKWAERCMGCGGTRKKRAASTSLCYYCSSGFEGHDDAMRHIAGVWKKMLPELEKRVSEEFGPEGGKGRHKLRVVKDDES